MPHQPILSGSTKTIPDDASSRPVLGASGRKGNPRWAKHNAREPTNMQYNTCPTASATQLLDAYRRGRRDFRHWTLTGADLRNVDLREAHLEGARLTRVNLYNQT